MIRRKTMSKNQYMERRTARIKELQETLSIEHKTPKLRKGYASDLFFGTSLKAQFVKSKRDTKILVLP
jgi:hypothetical protein